MLSCECTTAHTPRVVVLTGGPGAGKTAVLELIRRSFCEHIVVLPEAAGILFGGGFPRLTDGEGRRAVQRAHRQQWVLLVRPSHLSPFGGRRCAFPNPAPRLRR